MKLRVSFFAVVLSLALGGCHRNIFTRMYSATAEMQVRPRYVGPISWALEIEYIRSANVLTPVIQNLKLDQAWAKRFNSTTDHVTMQQALDHFHNVLKVEWLADTTTIKITGYSEVPQEAADIANGVADQYKAMRDQEEKALMTQGINVLRDQVARQAKVVEKTRVTAKRNPQDPVLRQACEQAQALLDALNIRLKQDIEEEPTDESPVFFVSRAEAPPE